MMSHLVVHKVAVCQIIAMERLDRTSGLAMIAVHTTMPTLTARTHYYVPPLALRGPDNISLIADEKRKKGLVALRSRPYEKCPSCVRNVVCQAQGASTRQSRVNRDQKCISRCARIGSESGIVIWVWERPVG